MKKELYERIEQLGLLEESELVELREDIQQDGWVSDMYGAPVEREKNINRVVAGLRASGAPDLIPAFGSRPPQGGGVSERYVQALEMQIQHMQKQLRQLHNQYNKVTQSQNKLIDRINALTGKQ